jgi:hypothetical protein
MEFLLEHEAASISGRAKTPTGGELKESAEEPAGILFLTTQG